MVKFLAISIICIVIGSVISDKVEEAASEKENNDSSKDKELVDIETLRILNDYGLIDSKNGGNDFGNLNKA